MRKKDKDRRVYPKEFKAEAAELRPPVWRGMLFLQDIYIPI
jgi:hypothetical protein